jgi:hypothetical protein
MLHIGVFAIHVRIQFLNGHQNGAPGSYQYLTGCKMSTRGCTSTMSRVATCISSHPLQSCTGWWTGVSVYTRISSIEIHEVRRVTPTDGDDVGGHYGLRISIE